MSDFSGYTVEQARKEAEQAGFERGRAEERAALAAHLREQIAKLGSSALSTTLSTGKRAALVDELTWLEAR